MKSRFELALLFAAAGAASAQTYTVREIAPVTGDGGTYAASVNSAGIVMAVSERPVIGSVAVFYGPAGQVAVMEPDPGTSQPTVWAGAINDTGTFVATEIVPNFPIGSTARASVSSLAQLPTRFALFVQTGRSGATDLSNAAPPFAVGVSSTGQQFGTSQWTIYHAYTVKVDGQNNPISDLGTLGGPFSRAESINDLGDVAGASLSAAGPVHAFLAPAGGTMTDLGTLGGPASWALGVNNSRVVVGWSRMTNGSARAFRWEGDVMTAIGSATGYSEADAINAGGQIVGMALDELGRPRASLYEGSVTIDLNSRIPAGTGWILQHAQDISDAGVIVGYGRRGGKTRGFILEPAPSCYPDCNADGALNLADFGCFQTRFALANPYADCNGDGLRNLSDFGCFQAKFALGCP